MELAVLNNAVLGDPFVYGVFDIQLRGMGLGWGIEGGEETALDDVGFGGKLSEGWRRYVASGVKVCPVRRVAGGLCRRVCGG
jgi:hypothetical protein